MFEVLYGKKVADLREECKKKNLSSKGKNLDLIQTLYPNQKIQTSQ